jgi:hypothetical protein
MKGLPCVPDLALDWPELTEFSKDIDVPVLGF